MAKISRSQITIANPSDRTITERNKFAGQMDSFTTFTWANVDMFANFGAFIINEKKGSLKLYNGASYSNNYVKQQYQDGYTNLSGVTFNTQQISFTIGVYWISIEDYRVLINLLHPYEVNILSFSFEPKYGYECKLSNIKDSTRYIVGNENTRTVTGNSNSNLKYSVLPTGNTGGYRYYTELNLTFDVIGKQCAKTITPFSVINLPSSTTYWNTVETSEEHYTTATNVKVNANDWKWKEIWPSDLEFPLTLNINNWFANASGPVHLRASAYISGPNGFTVDPLILFDITLDNLHTSQDNSDPTLISLVYDSEQALLYWKTGNKNQILSLLSITPEGKRFVKALTVNRFYWPGRLDFPEVENSDYSFVLKIEDINKNVTFGANNSQLSGTRPNVECVMRARTNVI